MTREEIIAGNKLIASFDEPDYYRYNDNGWVNHCGYHKLWNWLMPVVEKIDQGYDEVNISGETCEIKTNGYTAVRVGKTKIEAVWMAVVAYIEHVNKIANDFATPRR